MAIVSPLTSSLGQILHGKRYEVPIYQRPYSWTTEEAGELWADIEKNNPPYFLGIIVLEKTSDNITLKVVDGQQRLATLLLLLRSAAETLGIEDESAQRIQNEYINQKAIGAEKSEFTMTLSKRDMYSFFSLIDDTTHLPPQLSTGVRRGRTYTSSKRLNDVKQFFKNRLVALKNEKGNGGIISFITKKVLTLSFVEVQLENDSDIYLFFESLNAKGIDLTIADILKNLVCMVSDYPERASSNIDEIASLLGEGKMNSFLLHYAISRSTEDTPPTKKTLMRWYRDTIDREKDKFLDHLGEYAETYSLFLDPKKSNTIDKKRILTYLKALGATRCYPLLLVGNEFLSARDFLKLCEAIEKLTFRHSTIVGRDAKALEDLYYKLSKAIRNKNNFNKILETLNKQAGQITDQHFEIAFKEYLPGNNQVAKYILLKIDDSLNKQSISLDWDDITLEHILPAGAEWEGRDESLQRLGNMALLKGKLNTKLGNKDFKYKKERYRNETRFKLTHDLYDYEEFTKDTIAVRQEMLARFALKTWNSDYSSS